MNDKKYEENKCRICWTENEELDWNNLMSNHNDLTYRDCFYKYTQLECIDEDNLSNMICHICSNGLKFIDAFISRAIETNSMLQAAFLGTVINEEDIIAPTADSESILVAEIEIKEEENEIYISYEEDNNFSISENLFGQASLNPTYKDTERSKKVANRREIEIPNKMPIDEKVIEGIPDTAKITSLVRQLRTYYSELSNSSSKRRKKRNDKKSLIRHSNEEKIDETRKDKLTRLDSTGTNENNMKKFGSRTEVSPKTMAEKVLDENTKANKTSEKIFLCQYCSAECKGWYKLHTHEAKHSEVRKRTETCAQCGVKFYDKRSLRLHEKIHDANREKKFKCEYCKKAFYNMGALNVHKRIHLGLMVKCQICSKEFFRNIELYKHMNSHSSALINVEVKKRSRYFVRCKHCSKKILSTSFKSHTAAHLNQPLVKCSICNKEYFNRESCRHHIRTIHKKKPETVNEYVVLLKTDRLTHLYIRQNADVEPEEK